MPAALNPPRVEIATQSDAEEAALDSIFARLTTQNPATPSPIAKGVPSLGSEISNSPFRDRSGATKASTETLPSFTADLPPFLKRNEKTESAITSAIPEEKTKRAKKSNLEEATDTQRWEGMSQEDLEKEYSRKASEFINALPDYKGTAAHNFKAVSKKLCTPYAPDANVDRESNEILKERYVSAVIHHVNEGVKEGAKQLKAEFVKQTLKDNDGNFLSLCVTLVEEKYIALDNINDITGLCNAIISILPKAESAVKALIQTNKTTMAASIDETAEPVSRDSMDNATTWPIPEKRDNGKIFSIL